MADDSPKSVVNGFLGHLAPAATVTASAAAPVACSGEPTSYVGTPAVGTSRAVARAGVASVGPEDNKINQQRRRLVWSSVAAFLAAWFLAFFRFFLPRTLFEPATRFKIGYPAGIRSGSGHQVATEISHLGGPHTRSLVRDLRALHASGLHPRLEAQPRTNLNALAMAVATTAKGSTLRVRRRVPWTGPICNDLRTVRSW